MTKDKFWEKVLGKDYEQKLYQVLKQSCEEQERLLEEAKKLEKEE